MNNIWKVFCKIEKRSISLELKKGHNDTWILETTNSTENFHNFISSVMNENRVDHPDYLKKLKSRPFFQGGSRWQDSNGWIMIEFWNNSYFACLEFCCYLVEEFIHKSN